MFPADQGSTATVSSPPADSTSSTLDTQTKENVDEREVEDEDGEPNAAELRRRRLRKLETATSSSSSPPPPDNWYPCCDSGVLLQISRNSETTYSCFGSLLPLILVALAFHRLRSLTVLSCRKKPLDYFCIRQQEQLLFCFCFFCIFVFISLNLALIADYNTILQY